MTSCKLCGLDKPLRKGHIIPKFVTHYIKETSISGYLRQSDNLNKRVQDGLKVNLLCDECEKRFSKWESEFAVSIFFPHNQYVDTGVGIIKLEYDTSLIKFVISIFWRIIVSKRFVISSNKIESAIVESLERKWRRFLLGSEGDWGNCEFHLIFLDGINQRKSKKFPNYLNTYIFRLCDIVPFEIENSDLGIFVKLPGLLLFCSIIPHKHEGLIETKIHSIGAFYPDKQKINTQKIGNFLLARSLLIEKQISSISPTEWNKLDKYYKKLIMKLNSTPVVVIL